MYEKLIELGEIGMKRKLSAIFAIAIMILSVFIVAPLPIKAQQVALVTFRDMIFQDAATGDITLAPGNVPWNTVLNYPDNQSLMGDLYIVGLMAVNLAASYNLASWETGFTYDPNVLKCLSISNVSISPALPPTIFEIAAGQGKQVQWTPGLIITYNGTVTTHKHNLTTSGDYMTVNQPVFLAYIVFLVYGYGETKVTLTDTVLKDENGNPLNISIAPGYFKFRIHEVKLIPTVWTKPPYSIGNTTTIPINIITSEKVNYWEANVTFDPTILTPLAAVEGAFFKAAFPGYSTFTYSIGTGWVWANCSLPPCYNVSATLGSMLMAIVFVVNSYGLTLINVTDFIAKDCAGNEILPAPHFNLAEGLRMTIFKFEKLVILAPLFTPDMSPFRFWTYPTHTIGETFTVALRIVDTSQKVHSWKAGFRFNPKVLQVLDVTEGDYLFSQGSTTWTPGTIDNINGIVTSYNCTGGTGVFNTGPGTLMLITFNVTGYGRSLISFTDTDGDPCEAKLLDLVGNEITNPAGLSISLSVFEFRAPITIEMSMVGSVGSRYKHVAIGEVFNVTLTINSLENVIAWQSGLNFNPAMLNCIGVTFGGYLGVGTQQQQVVNNIAGYVSVAESILGTGYATGPGTLVNITFQVIDNELPIGPSVLDLIDAETFVIDWNGDKCTLATLRDGAVRIIGDISGDGNVDVTDMLALKVAITKIMRGIMTHEQAIAENPFYELQIDGNVDVTDMLKLKVIITKIMRGLPWP